VTTDPDTVEVWIAVAEEFDEVINGACELECEEVAVEDEEADEDEELDGLGVSVEDVDAAEVEDNIKGFWS
jgi:hypothetical protein